MRRLLVGALLALLAGCGSPNFQSYDDAAYAGAVCADAGHYRVPDDYCPIGDGDVPGYAYHWAYRPYTATTRDIDVVYVGHPVDTHTWVNVRPANVATLHIDRGSFPDAPAAGQPRTSAARVVTEPARQAQPSAAVSRGGLGSTTATAATAKTAAPPKRTPPPPAGKRPMAAAKAKSR